MLEDSSFAPTSRDTVMGFSSRHAGIRAVLVLAGCLALAACHRPPPYQPQAGRPFRQPDGVWAVRVGTAGMVKTLPLVQGAIARFDTLTPYVNGCRRSPSGKIIQTRSTVTTGARFEVIAVHPHARMADIRVSMSILAGMRHLRIGAASSACHLDLPTVQSRAYIVRQRWPAS